MYRRIVTSALAAVTLSVAAVGFAAPASATQTENLADCNASLNGAQINVTAGQDLLIRFTTCTTSSATLRIGTTSNPSTSTAVIGGAEFRVQGSPNPNPVPWTIEGFGQGSVGSPLPVGSYTVFFTSPNNLQASFAVTVASPAPDPAPASSGSGPASVIQQFGKPATGSCDANQPEGLDWAGVPAGGWAESWAEWMNGGAGGAVCTRTLVHRSGALGWRVLT